CTIAKITCGWTYVLIVCLIVLMTTGIAHLQYHSFSLLPLNPKTEHVVASMWLEVNISWLITINFSVLGHFLQYLPLLRIIFLHTFLVLGHFLSDHCYSCLLVHVSLTRPVATASGTHGAAADDLGQTTLVFLQKKGKCYCLKLGLAAFMIFSVLHMLQHIIIVVIIQ
ncbi:hypothetical protein ACJX0J_008184, partial [Zea mays]